MKVTGKVVSGIGEGKFFLSMEHYKNEIKNKLKMQVYPGTLNIDTGKHIYEFNKLSPIRIDGYTKDGKIFGGATCYMAKINNIECAIIVPDITRHSKNMVELIANEHLRSKLNLKDNDDIEVVVK